MIVPSISANSSAVASSPLLLQPDMSPAATTTDFPLLRAKGVSSERSAPELQPTARIARARATITTDGTFLTLVAATEFSVGPVSQSYYDVAQTS
jgi:hypothetical protein